MEPVKQYYKNLSESLIKEFAARNIEAHFFEDSSKMLDYLKDLIPSSSVVSWGGSMTLKETGAFDFLKSGKFKALDRAEGGKPGGDK